MFLVGREKNAKWYVVNPCYSPLTKISVQPLKYFSRKAIVRYGSKFNWIYQMRLTLLAKILKSNCALKNQLWCLEVRRYSSFLWSVIIPWVTAWLPTAFYLPHHSSAPVGIAYVRKTGCNFGLSQSESEYSPSPISDSSDASTFTMKCLLQFKCCSKGGESFFKFCHGTSEWKDDEL